MPDDVDQSDYYYDDAASGCGVTLLSILFKESADGIDGDAGDAVEAIILALCQIGPAELSPICVKRHFNEIVEWNEESKSHIGCSLKAPSLANFSP